MISYFKYTQGEAFTLDGSPYVGFFNITGDKAYSEKTKNTLSTELTPNTTFISDFYMNKMEFDNQYDSINTISPVYSNVFNIINKEELDKVLDTINKNNLLVFKSLVINNPQIIDFDENNSHYYGLSSTLLDSRPEDTVLGKENISQIDPFSFSSKWEFLDRVKYGTMIVKSDQTFKYLCSTGSDIIILKGSFIDPSYIEFSIENLEIPQEIYQIYYDEVENKISIVINDEIKIYDAINFIECDNLILIDSIKLYDIDTEVLTWGIQKTFSDVIGKFSRRFWNKNTNSTEYMRFGNNYRTSLDNNVLTLWNKYAFAVVSTINLLDFGIENVLNINIRNVDDFVSILHQKDGQFKISFFDPLDITTLKTFDIYEFETSSNYSVSFSNYDSNVFYLNSKDQTQTRLISNPQYPVGSMREENLKYPKKYAFGNTYQKFVNSNIKWNTNALDSNYYTNYFLYNSTKTDKIYMLLHNSGRLYPIYQNISNAYQTSINLNTVKYFNGLQCSDNSFGLFFNKTLSSILKDILNLYTKATNSYVFEKNDVYLSKIDEITYETNNLYINGNESVNIVTLQRIFNLLTDLQKKLIANLIS